MFGHTPRHAGVLVTCVLVAAAACGGNRPHTAAEPSVSAPEQAASRKPCAPADTSFAQYGMVFSDCEVDRQAKVRGTFRPNWSPSRGSTIQSCLKAEVHIVVDENGAPIVPSAKLVQSTDPTFGAAVLEAARTSRYSAAQKAGEPVKQLVRIVHGGVPEVRMVVVGQPSANTRPTPMQRNPC